MSKEEAKDQLIDLLMGQVADLSMMSKIELGNDVIEEINRLRSIIGEDENPGPSGVLDSSINPAENEDK
jgi:hypothetical protein